MLTFLLLFALVPDLDCLAAAAEGTIGVAAVHLETGQGFGARQDVSFPMQSVFKLPIAIEVLAQVDAGKLGLEQLVTLTAADRRAGVGRALVERYPATLTVRALLEAMVIRSDNTACDRLLALLGGPARVSARMNGLGLAEIVVDRSEKELAAGLRGDTATPRALASLLGKLAQAELGLAPGSQALLRELLRRVETGSGRITAGLPAGTVVEHKTGTSRTIQGVTETTNDAALVTLPDGSHLALVVLVRDAHADEKTREGTIAEIARAAFAWAAADRPGSALDSGP